MSFSFCGTLPVKSPCPAAVSVANVVLKSRVVVRYCPFVAKVHYVEREWLWWPLRLRLRLRISGLEEQVADIFALLLNLLASGIPRLTPLFMLPLGREALPMADPTVVVKLNRMRSSGAILLVPNVGRKRHSRACTHRDPQVQTFGGAEIILHQTLEPSRRSSDWGRRHLWYTAAVVVLQELRIHWHVAGHHGRIMYGGSMV